MCIRDSSIALLIRKDVFNDVGLFDESLHLEDFDMWLRIANRYKIGYVEDDEVFYRQVNNSWLRILQKRGSNYYKDHFNVLYKHFSFLNHKEKKDVFLMLYNLFKAHIKRNRKIDWGLSKKIIIVFLKTIIY